jgi:hypothetical protein
MDIMDKINRYTIREERGEGVCIRKKKDMGVEFSFFAG